VRPHAFDRIFSPRAIAVFGAEEDESVGGRVLHNLAAGGFSGGIYAVGRQRFAAVPLRRCAALDEVDGPVDLAVIATATGLRDVVRACGQRGVAGAVIPARPTLADGRRSVQADLSTDVIQEAARYGLRLIGPNSVGIMHPAAGMNATFTSGAARTGSLALVSQSGAICAAVLDWATTRRVGFSIVASLGDAVDVDLGELLEYLAFDAETRSVLLYVERVRCARSFVTGLRVAARLKPVIIVKAGRGPMDADERAAPAPASADDAFDAAVARAGAVRVRSIEQMFAAANLLGMGKDVAGHRLAIVSNGRGPGLLAADRAADLGVAVTPLAAATRVELDDLSPAVGDHRNPVDLLGEAPPGRYRRAVEICQADPGVDAVLAVFVPQAFASPLETAKAVVAAARGSPKPLLACWMGDELVSSARSLFVAEGVPDFATPESAVDAFSFLASYRRNQRLLRRVPGPLAAHGSPLTSLARDVVGSALARGREQLTTSEARKLLAAFGIRWDPSGASCSRGKELFVGISRDGTFGPVIRLGLAAGALGRGGERIVALPPLDGAIIQTLLRTSRIAGVFSSLAHMAPEEMGAIERMLWALSELACELPEVRELELHPLAVSGGEVVATGARVAVAARPPGTGRYQHMAIHPYPSDIRERWEVADGTSIIVRPIRPEDAQMEASFVRNLSQNTRYFRFMVPLNGLPEELLARLTQIDYGRELALVAVIERDGREVEVGVARYMMAQDGRSANVAVVVADEWQGKGIGSRLLRRLIDAARASGIPRLEGEILSENAPMRAILVKLGCTLRRNPASPDTVLFELDLS
jgi:acetyltransferase